MSLLDDYGQLLKGRMQMRMPGTTGPPTPNPGFLDPQRAALKELRSPGFYPDIATKPDNLSRDQIADVLTGYRGDEGDRPSTSEKFSPFGKNQGQLAQGSPIPSPYPDAAQMAMDPKPMLPTPPNPDVAALFDPKQMLPPPKFNTASFDAVPPVRPEPPTQVAAAPPAPTPLPQLAEKMPTPPPRPLSVGPVQSSAPLPPSRPPGLLASNPTQETAKPTGVPMQSAAPNLVETPPAPAQSAAGAGGSPLASNPVSATPASITNPITPPSMFDGGGQDLGQGLGPADLGRGEDDWGMMGGGDMGGGFAGDFGGGGDVAGAGGGDFGGGGDAGGGGGLGGIGAIFGALGKMAGGGGGGSGQAPAPKIPHANPPKLQAMENDPAIAKRMQGAQQVVSGLLADPSLIDPRKRQGLLA